MLDRLEHATKPRSPAVVATPLGGTPGPKGSEGRSAGLRYLYSTNTEETGASSAHLKFNKAPALIEEATKLGINYTDADGGADISYISSWDDSTSATKGFAILRKVGSPSTFAIFRITGALTDLGGAARLPVECVAKSGTFASEDSLTVEFYRNGDRGEKGEKGATGAGMPSGVTDWGLVTKLPESPAKGDRCQYIADKTNGIIWHLVYDGEGTLPWKKIGGAPLNAVSNTARTVNSVTYVSLPTDPLSIVVPLKGDYDIEVQACPVETSLEGYAVVSYAIGATAASDAWSISVGIAKRNSASDALKTRQAGVAAGAKIEEKARTSEPFNAVITRRRLWVDPVRVG